MIVVQNYVGGNWVDAAGARFRSINPATGEALAEAPATDAADVDAAVRAARRAFDDGDWRFRKGSERGAALLKLADELERRARPISELIAREMGKPVRVNLAREVEGAVDKLRFFAGAARLLEGRVTGSTASEIWDMELPEPVGVAALIIPWNDPVDPLEGFVLHEAVGGEKVMGVGEPADRASDVGLAPRVDPHARAEHAIDRPFARA